MPKKKNLHKQCEEVFKSYWAIENVQGQWQFINSHITVTEKARTRTRGNESPVKSRRKSLYTLWNRSLQGYVLKHRSYK